jgi:flavodoxin
MKTLLIVYHSTTGGARQMAHAAAAGAKTEGAAVQTRLLYATDTAPEDVLSADAYVFAAPENLASMSGLTTVRLNLEQIQLVSEVELAGVRGIGLQGA